MRAAGDRWTGIADEPRERTPDPAGSLEPNEVASVGHNIEKRSPRKLSARASRLPPGDPSRPQWRPLLSALANISGPDITPTLTLRRLLLQYLLGSRVLATDSVIARESDDLPVVLHAHQ
jgi:hypothetical protein